jgi:predicted O-methyltransferase YrrM
LNLIKEYLFYQLRAKNRHGIHSPFVYEFTDKCLALKLNEKHLRRLNSYLDALKQDHDTIQITDYGAGSKKLGDKRKVSQILKVSSSGKKYSTLLAKIAAYYQPKKILELGTSLGVGTLSLHLASPNSVIKTIEGCSATASKAAHYLLMHGHKKNIKQVVDKFESELKKDVTTYDLIFIDGNHQSEAVLNILNLLKNNYHDDTIIILDDIRWSKDMKSLWKQLVNSNEYHLTMDLFRMGIIMKRSHQRKEHFIIRY